MKTSTLSCRALLGLTIFFAPAIARAAPGDLYVTKDFNPGSILQFTPDGTPHTFTTGLNGPWALAFDSSHNLVETDNNGGFIYKFTPDGIRTTIGSLFDVLGLAIDTSDNVYAANSSGNIYKYASDGSRTLFAFVRGAPYALAFDTSGNLFATSQDTILRITPSGGKSLFASGFQNAHGLAFDSVGNLFVADDFAGTIIKVAPNGTQTMFASGLSVGGGSPTAIAFDSSGSLFAVGFTTNSIFKFAPDGTQSTFATGVSSLAGLAFEPGIPEPNSGNLLNISTRLRVQTGENVLIGGFIVTGTASKKIILRAIGPSLVDAGVLGFLPDPTLELRDSNATLIASNDDWKINDQTHQSQEAEIRATTVAPSNDLESALVANLSPSQGYTAIVRGKSADTGIAVVEAYDLDQAADSILANISTRGFVGTSSNVMIGGLILGGGNGRGKVLVRAIGPSLSQSGVGNPLGDPLLELYNANGVKQASNDNWKIDDQSGSSQEAQIRATTIPPGNDLESALLITLTAGNYTAIVSGKGQGTGVGLVEAYNLK
jgi:hypothetical protein